MDLTERHTFSAPIDRVWEMFSDPASHVAKFEGMGHRNVEVLESEGDDRHLHLVVRRVVEVEIPGFARKVLKPTNTVTSTDDWHANDDGTYGGTFAVDIQGAPVKSSGTTRLTPAGDRTDYEINVLFDVKVPLIGGRIASWAKGDVSKQIGMEFEAGDRWLAEHA